MESEYVGTAHGLYRALVRRERERDTATRDFAAAVFLVVDALLVVLLAVVVFFAVADLLAVVFAAVLFRALPDFAGVVVFFGTVAFFVVWLELSNSAGCKAAPVSAELLQAAKAVERPATGD